MKYSGELSYRPIVTISYFIDYSLWHINPFGYHLTGVILHCLNTILIYILINLTSKNKLLGFISCVIFTIHPCLSEAVNCISYREDLLAAFFLLISFILFIKISNDLPVQKNTPWINNLQTILIYLGSLLSFFLALLSKEMAITLPLLIIIYEITLRPLSLRKTILNKIWLYAGYLSITALYVYIRFFLFNLPHATIGYPEEGIFINIKTMTKVIASYIKLLFFPLTLNADHYVPISAHLFDLEFICSLSLLIITLIITIRMFRYSRPVSFSIVWFFITLIPVYNIIPIINIMSERYLYIPVIGFCALIGALSSNKIDLNMIIKPANLRLALIGLFLLSLSVFYAAITVKRNKDWKDDFTLWTKTVETSPDSYRGHNNIGREYLSKGMLDKAMLGFKNALQLKNDYYDAIINIGLVYEKQGQFDKAAIQYKDGLKLRPYSPIAYNNLGHVYYQTGLKAEAIRGYETAIRINPYYPDAHNNLGVLLYENGLNDEAIREYRLAIQYNPYFADAHNNLGASLYKKGLIDEAIDEYQKAIKLDQNHINAHNNLGAGYYSRGLQEKAFDEFRKVLEIDYNHTSAHINLGMIYMDYKNDEENALFHLMEAVRIDPSQKVKEEVIEIMKAFGIPLKNKSLNLEE